MDHMYAATSPLSGADVEITPPPAPAPYLPDHSFARPPSECSQVASDSHGENQSPKTRSSVSKPGQLVETRAAAKQQEQGARTRRDASKQIKASETQGAVKQNKPPDTKGAAKQNSASETQRPAKQEQPATTTRRSSSRWDQSIVTTASAKEQQPTKTKKSAVSQELSKTTDLANQQGQSQETGKKPPRQQDLAKKTIIVNIKSDQSPLTRKVNSKHNPAKNTDERPETNIKVSDKGDGQLGSGKVTEKQDVSEETKKLSNGKDTDVQADTPGQGRKSGRLRQLSQTKCESAPPKSALKNKVEESGEDSVAVAKTALAPSIPEGRSVLASDMPTVSPVLMASSGEGGPSSDHHTSVCADSPSVGQDETHKNRRWVSADGSASSRCISQGKDVESTVCEQEKIGKHSSGVLDRASSTEAQSQSQIVSEATDSLKGKDGPCSLRTSGLELVEKPGKHKATADTADNQISAPVQERNSSKLGDDDGGTSGSGRVRRKHSRSVSVSDDGNNNSSGAGAQGEGKSSPSPPHSLCHSSAEPMDTDQLGEEKTMHLKDTVHVDDNGASHSCKEPMDTDDIDNETDCHGGGESTDKSGGDDKTSGSDILQSANENQGDTIRQAKTEDKQANAESVDGVCSKSSSAEADGELTSSSDKKNQSDNSESVDIAANGAVKKDSAGSGGQDVDKADTSAADRQSHVVGEEDASRSQASDSDLGSDALHNICAAVQLKRKVPDGEEEKARTARKRTAAEAGLDTMKSCSDVFRSSPSWDVSPSSSISIHTYTSSTSSPASHSRPKVKKASVPRADPSEFPDIEKYRIPLRDHGWRREVVVREIYDEVRCKMPPADIYYFSPDGRKLRSGVMINTYLSEHPSPLTPDNFTFMKKAIWKEPWEMLRQAGKGGACAGRKKKSAERSPKTTPPKKKAMVKVTKTKAQIDSGSISTSSLSVTGSIPTSIRPKVRPAYLSSMEEDDNDSDDFDSDPQDDDQDYNPWKEEESPAWNKRRTYFGHRHKPGRPLKLTPEREVLIQSFPEPEIIIDRADESLYAGENSCDKGDVGEMDRESKPPPRMMLLPSDIKDDSEVEGGAPRNVGSVHIHGSPEMYVKPHSKPTARKSTMPRVSHKKIRNKSTDLMGQLCSTRCPRMSGVGPSLQCSVCMCLFHHQCVNINPTYSLPTQFKCLRCRDVVVSEHAAVVSLLTSSGHQPSLPPTTPTMAIASTTSLLPPLPRVIGVVVRQGSSLPLSTLPSPLMTNLLPSHGSMGASQLLRSLTQAPPPPVMVRPAHPIPVKHTPLVAPPTLVKGGPTPTSAVRFSVVPPHRHPRPLPRLTAAPGVAVSPSFPPLLLH